MTRMLVDLFSAEAVSPLFPALALTNEDTLKLDSYQVIAGHISYSDLVRFPDRRWITVLRDPVDRCLSVYAFWRQFNEHPLIPLDEIRNENNAFEATSLARQLPVEEFFNCKHPHVLQNISNRMVWQLGAHAVFERRQDFSETEALKSAMRTLKHCDFVGDFSSLDDDISHLLTHLNRSREIRLPKLNVTKSPVRKFQISRELLEQISALNVLDNELYNWAKCNRGRNFAAPITETTG
jgi:hypothetical protein